jgi:arylsulfatase A-like enzyme
MACNWPLRGTKRTLFEGGVRGVGLIHGAGIKAQPPTQPQGLVHAADWMHSVLAHLRTLPGPSGGSAGKSDPPMVLGDGLDLWDCLAAAKPWGSSARTELLHEAHPETDAQASEGNGQALRVGELKVVLRSGKSWSVGSNIHSNDGTMVITHTRPSLL